MRCWNCNRELLQKAKVCAHCEAPVMAQPTVAEMQAARDLLEQLPPEVAAELQEALLEEFADRILVGNCPKCDSLNTSHCENDPEIGELLVGRCYDCGQLWCTECGRLLEPQTAVCECWTEEESSEEHEAAGE